jgi:acylaminoacyl-peptidase
VASSERFARSGHGFQKPPNRLSFIAIAEAFFARHLGGACEPVGRDFERSASAIFSARSAA